MKRPSIFKNNCFVEIIPLVFIESFIYYQSKVDIRMKTEKESFKMDPVAATITPSCYNNSSPAGDTYQVGISFRIPYVNPETTNLLQILKGYGSLIATYYSAGREHTVLGTEEYPVFLNYDIPPNFDGYEVNITGTQDTPPLTINS